MRVGLIQALGGTMHLGSVNQRAGAKALGCFWLLVATALIVSAIALFRVDALDLPAHDPSNIEFWFGTLNILLALPFLLCGVALLSSWPKTVRWVAIPSSLLLLVVYSLWTARTWYAA
jgi:ABC-type polysaccharide/polyol phosphate export permease